MSKTRNAVIANLTFVLGQMEELKSNINDTMRYIKQNGEKWEDTESPQPSENEVKEESEETPK
jgi:ABC-type amino acid transport substrate-binding protein